MSLFIYQLKQAVFSLKQKPMFTLSVITTMGVTLGALLCMLTLAYVMLIKPLPYPDQARLFNIEHQLVNQGNVAGNAFTYPNLMYLYNKQTVFEQTALSYYDADVITSLLSEPMKEINFVTPEWFSMLGTKLVLGRAFGSSEQLNSYNPVAIISYNMWQTDFLGAADILNQKLTFGGRSYQIIGVVAQENIELSLSGPSFKTNIYAPWDFNPTGEANRNAWGNDDSGLTILGKLKSNSADNLTAEQINQQLTQFVNDNWQQQVNGVSFFQGWSINISAIPLKSYLVNDSKKSLLLLILGAFGLVIIATANIANLFISRTAERQHQLAISAAIGASKQQLFMTILAETLLLMLGAMVVAQAVIYFSFHIINQYLSEYLPRTDELAFNSFSFSLSLGVLLLFSLIFSLLCRRVINYRSLNSALQSSGKSNGIQVSTRIRNMLIASQITVATTLIFLNIVLFQDANALAKQPLGYDTNNINAAVFALPNAENEELATTLSELKTTLINHPKIAEISQAMRPAIFGTFAITTQANNQRFSIAGKDVDHSYFPLINQPIIEGDNFSASQIKNRELVTVINDVFAEILAPNGSALGIKFNNGARVIGVVKSINIPGRISQSPRFYYPASISRNMLLIKTHPNQDLTRDELVALIKTVDSRLSLFSYSSLSHYKNERLFSAKATAYTTMALTIITFFLSGLGLFGVLKYSSQIRKFEIGARMAIGAKGKDIIKLVLRDNSAALIIGISASVVVLSLLYLGFSQALSSYVSLHLIPVFMVTVALITLLSILSCYLPLRQYINKPVIHCLKGSE